MCWGVGVTTTAFSRERGASLSVATALLVPVVVLAGGLAVDGAQQARAARQAHAIAASATRAGCDAMSAAVLSGRADSRAGRLRAEQVAARGDASVRPRQVEVEAGDGWVRARVVVARPTFVVSLVGIDEVHGEATVRCHLRAG